MLRVLPVAGASLLRAVRIARKVRTVLARVGSLALPLRVVIRLRVERGMPASKLRAVVKVPTGEKTSKGMAVELDNAKGEFKLGTSGDAVLEGEQRPLLAGMM